MASPSDISYTQGLQIQLCLQHTVISQDKLLPLWLIPKSPSFKQNTVIFMLMEFYFKIY